MRAADPGAALANAVPLTRRRRARPFADAAASTRCMMLRLIGARRLRRRCLAAFQPEQGTAPGSSFVSAIVAENVSKHWTTAEGQVHAVDGISFALDEGTLNVLLGPSGCGKSTTLRLIAGLEEADGGRILIAGRDVTNLPPAQRNIAMVFQSYALFPHLSVAENIVFGLKVRKVSAAETAARLKRVAELLGLSTAARPQAGAAVRRPAAARGARPRDHRRGAGVPDGRAAVEPRRPAAPGHARRDPVAAARRSASRWSTSRTTRSRRCRWPTA